MKTYLNIIYTLLLLIPFGVFGQVVNTTPVNLVGSSDPIPGPGPFGLHPFTPSPLTGTYHGGVFFGGTREKWGYEISDLTIGDTYTLTVYYMMDLTFGTPAYDRIGNLTLLSGAPLDIPTIPYVPEPDWRNWYTMEVTFTAVDVTDRIDIEADGLSDNSLWLYTDMSIDGDGACDELTTTVSATDICIGDLVTLEASSTNGGTVTWSDGVVDGVSFPLATAGVFSYTATSDNEDDCVFEVDITVHEPDVTAAVDDDVICLGETAIFTGGGADTYSWDMGVTNGTAFEPLAAGNFTHTVTGIDAFGCTNTATVDLFVSPLPRVDLEFIADGVSSEDGSTGGCIINAVQFNDLSTISDLGDITGWEWRFGDGSTSSLENPDHTYGAAGTYNVTLTVTTADGCTATYTTTITMVESITIDIISNEPSCFGFSDGSIIINIVGGGGGDDVVYEIKDVDGNVLNIDNSNAANSLKAGTYTYTIGDGTACSGEGTVTLSQPEQLDIDITTFDPLCFGDKTGWARINEVFNATGDNDRISYIWNPNPTENSGVGADSIWNLGFGEYTITINDENGCSNVFDFMIDQPKVLEFVELGYEPAYCRLYDYQKGNGVVKAAMIGGVADYGYLWTNLQTGETSTNSTWGGLNPGEYQMVATDANGCTLTETITVDSLNPRANFEITSDQFTTNYKGTADIDAHFVNLSENFANPFNPLADTTFFWNFDSPQGGWVLSEALEENFDTVYQARGESYDIDVCLVAINKNGCTDTLCKNIVIYEPIEFKHVNIFSPNGDGMNDIFTFQFQSKSISEFHCVIVDRWGVTKTELDHVTEGWDGTDKSGSKCTDGVYFYTYEAITDDGTELVGQGTVQIVGSK